jgi:hypothetical protein
MLRQIAGFIVGYILMMAIVVLCFLVGPMLLGVDRVFQPGSYDASMLWVIIAMGITLFAALAGGAICTLIAASKRPAIVMAAIVVILGSINIFMGAGRPNPPPRPADQSLVDAFQSAMEYGREPLLTRVSNPVLGGLGVLLGMALARPRRARAGLDVPTEHARAM